MMKVKTKIKLSQLKVKALELRAKKQLPYQLVQYIYDLNDKSNNKLVLLLMELTEHYLRISHYYAKYPLAEELANEDIKKRVAELK